ncbi:MAG: amidohydrolase [Flavobacteriales bacterium]|nr:amidohydrolase [Flavobacteriales bacterium]
MHTLARNAFLVGALFTVVLLSACGGAGGDTANTTAADTTAHTLYHGGDIVTMEGDSGSTVEAVVVAADRIVYTGALAGARKAYPTASMHDLKGATLMPGLIEQHLHPLLGALFLTMPAIAPEAWETPEHTWPAATSAEDYLAKLKASFAAHTDTGSVYWTWGYHSYFHGKLDRRALDALSATVPIGVWHRSCHEFIVNTAFLKHFGIDAAAVAKAPKEARAQIDLAKGHFFENGAMMYLLPLIQSEFAGEATMRRGLALMMKQLHRKGITAYNEPGAVMDASLARLYAEVLGGADVPLFSSFLVEGNTLFMTKGDSALPAAERMLGQLPREGKVRFLPGHIKFLADGAIISQLMQMKGGYLDGHHGEWMLKPEYLDPATKLFWDKGYQLHIHVNGDLGLEEVLNAITQRMQENPRKDHRTVIVHFANSTDEQVKRASELGCIISANPYYVTGFADKYCQIGLGCERSNAMVRLGPAEDLGMHISLHSDLPMGPADPLYLAWCAVTRTTHEGHVVRPDLAVSRHTALRAITIEAAYSWRMEEELGSIKAGKKANFTVLEKNPYRVSIAELKDIPVQATVFEGRLFPVAH